MVEIRHRRISKSSVSTLHTQPRDELFRLLVPRSVTLRGHATRQRNERLSARRKGWRSTCPASVEVISESNRNAGRVPARENLRNQRFSPSSGILDKYNANSAVHPFSDKRNTHSESSAHLPSFDNEGKYNANNVCRPFSDKLGRRSGCNACRQTSYAL